MTTNRLPAICSGEQRAGARIRLNLIRDEDNHIELFSHTLQPVKVLEKLVLSLAELTATSIVVTETRNDAVDNKEAIFAARKVLGQISERFVLVLTVLDTDNGDVLVGCPRVNAESLCDLLDTLWTIGSLSVWRTGELVGQSFLDQEQASLPSQATFPLPPP